MKKIALVTGANRGIGLEFVRQLKDSDYYVIACCRNPSKATQLKQMADQIIQLDITKDKDIDQLTKTLNNKPIDLLVNNAGTSGEPGVTINHIERNNFLNVLNINCIGTVKICDALLPNLQASQDKNIIVISSRMGSISDNEQGRSYAYRASKAALNCVMRSFAIDVKSMGIHVMLLHPGWVRTDMGGENAVVEVEASVAGMLTQAEQYMPESHARELRRFDGGTIDW